MFYSEKNPYVKSLWRNGAPFIRTEKREGRKGGGGEDSKTHKMENITNSFGGYE